MLKPPLSSVGQAEKMLFPFRSRVPLQAMAKPEDGAAPTSHWNWVVGAVRMQPRPEESVKAERCQYVEQRERMSRLTAVVDAVLCFRQILSYAILTV